MTRVQRYRWAVTVPSNVTSYGEGVRNLALVLPSDVGRPDVQLDVARRLALDPATTAVALPRQPADARRELIWRLRDSHPGVTGLVSPSRDPRELARVLPDANAAWPVEGVVGHPDLDLSQFLATNRFTDFFRYPAGDAPIMVGEDGATHNYRPNSLISWKMPYMD